MWSKLHPVIKILLLLVVIVPITVGIWLLIAQLPLPEWVGVGSYDAKTTITTDPNQNQTIAVERQAPRTYWDLLALLVLPLTLAVGGILGTDWLNRQQQDRQSKYEEARDARMQEAEEKRTASERTQDAEQKQDAVLQTYFTNMTELLVKYSLATAKPDDSVSHSANAFTLFAFTRLDVSHKLQMLRFLVNAGLMFGENSIIGLVGLDLRDLQLNEFNFSGANLRRANLQKVTWANANLRGADLTQAKFDAAKLEGASLSETLLHGAHFRDAILTNANLQRAKFHTNPLDDLPDEEFEQLPPDIRLKYTMEEAEKYISYIQGQTESFRQQGNAQTREITELQIKHTEDLLGILRREKDELVTGRLHPETINRIQEIEKTLERKLEVKLLGQTAEPQDQPPAPNDQLPLSMQEQADRLEQIEAEELELEATLERLKLEQETTIGANFEGAILKDADLRDAYIRYAYFSGAKLINADLRGALITHTDLSGADLTGAKLDGAVLHKVNVTPEQLAQAASRPSHIS